MAGISSADIFWAGLSPLIYGGICLLANKARPFPVLVAAFIVGFAVSYVAYFVEVSLGLVGFRIQQNGELAGYLAFVAAPEELVKLAALIGLAYRANSARCAGLAVACFIGCGFAASENIVYLYRYGGDIVSARFMTATAFHVFNAVIMARVFRTQVIVDESVRIVFSLAVAISLHGLYDYFVVSSAEDGGRFTFVLAFTVAAGLTTLRAHPMRRHDEVSG